MEIIHKTVWTLISNFSSHWIQASSTSWSFLSPTGLNPDSSLCCGCILSFVIWIEAASSFSSSAKRGPGLDSIVCSASHWLIVYFGFCKEIACIWMYIVLLNLGLSKWQWYCTGVYWTPCTACGSTYRRVTARRDRQNHIVSEPDIEPGLSPATDSQVLEVAQALATRESEVGTERNQLCKPVEWLAHVYRCVFVCFRLSSIVVSSTVPTMFFHFHDWWDRRYVSVSLATFDRVCCLALLLSLAFKIANFELVAEF